MTKQAKIVAMTCTHAALKRREFLQLGLKYDNLLMEESAQILEIETFIPMLLQVSFLTSTMDFGFWVHSDMITLVVLAGGCFCCIWVWDPTRILIVHWCCMWCPARVCHPHICLIWYLVPLSLPLRHPDIFFSLFCLLAHKKKLNQVYYTVYVTAMCKPA